MSVRTRFGSTHDRTAGQPPEYRGLARDGVRLLVATESGITHARFRELPEFLSPGDLLVVNNSATIAAEVDGHRRGRGAVVLHAAAELADGSWVVELRSAPDASRPVLDAERGEVVELGEALTLTLLAAYPREGSSPTGVGNRLWRAAVSRPSLDGVLRRHGRPVTYG
ncbi:MAG TPA: S-adenosylmethionine:tRNA ribosyltransferase-isomerase [Nocardioidaceae bacterium]|nr:S-adenosylmethionine:tRNA ribosyltransferase-isomerase [Nocardioidaceae bacterium]